MKRSTRILRWYDANGRDLPWRRTTDPYKILVSEIMLQQTQVQRVLLFYKAWLKQFPNWKSLAEATNAQVIKAWAGLGYNRRALMLRDAAKEVARFGEPSTEEGWRKLKGVGDYTAAAVHLFSQNGKTVPVDTNIRRILGRLLLEQAYAQPEQDQQIREAGEQLMQETGRHADLGQALFDLATEYCTKDPSCLNCPLRSTCPMANAFEAGQITIPQQMIPRNKERIQNGKKYPDRIYRGRILRLVREAGNSGVARRGLGKKIDPTFNPQEDNLWLRQMLERLERDKLIKKKRHCFVLYD